MDHADAGDDARTGGAVVVQLPSGQRGQLHERRVRVAHQIDAVPRQDLAPAVMPLDRALPPRPAGDGEPLPLGERAQQVGIGSSVLLELAAASVNTALEQSHVGADSAKVAPAARRQWPRSGA